MRGVLGVFLGGMCIGGFLMVLGYTPFGWRYWVVGALLVTIFVFLIDSEGG